ncbi:MAG: thrombospondin type 3 repeat-containing protein [Polyangiaceae bacterium]|nr:thrombospondin type 3 repeat-containing protein [Polyangiaceae bacterium]
MTSYINRAALLLATGVLAVATPRLAAAAPLKVVQTSLKGGIATDGTGVATPRGPDGNTPADPSAFYDSWRPIELKIPAGATIQKAYLAVHGGFDSVPTNAEQRVRFAGKSLAEAGAPVFSNTNVRVYDVTTGFGVSPAVTQYAVQERGDSDPFLTSSGPRIGGEQLVVVYAHAGSPQRQVSWFIDDAFGNAAGTSTVLDGLPTCSQGTRTVTTSFGIIWETESEQNSGVFLKQGSAPEQLISSVLGGCDDGQTPTTPGWRALFTVGSFGSGNDGVITGVSGDDFSKEPRVDGTNSNSRLSDELVQISGPATADTWTIRFVGDGDSKLTSLITVIEQEDTDCDDIKDVSDNCPTIINTDQTDTDTDGVGNVCDNCPTTKNTDQADLDKDGKGDACDDDIDGDGKLNAVDNCPTVPNADQADADGDKKGDVCDDDLDGDGLSNVIEASIGTDPTKKDSDGTPSTPMTTTTVCSPRMRSTLPRPRAWAMTLTVITRRTGSTPTLMPMGCWTTRKVSATRTATRNPTSSTP